LREMEDAPAEIVKVLEVLAWIFHAFEPNMLSKRLSGRVTGH